MTAPGFPPPPEPPPPPWPYQPPAPPPKLRRPYVGGVIALGLAALSGCCAFLPWFETLLGGEELTGWQIYEKAVESGENPILITDFFTSGMSPLFTGLAVVIDAVILGLGALVVVFGPKTVQPSRFTIPAGLAWLVFVTSALAAVPALATMLSAVFIQPRPYLLVMGPGLAFAAVLAIAAWVALVIGMSGMPARQRT
jgi:hypothetical protein